MRVLALDIGERRVGVAGTDPSGRVALPLDVLDASVLRGDFREIVGIVGERGAELLLIGLPLTMAGDEGPQASNIREIAASMARYLPIPVQFADERFSSAEARNAAMALGVSSRDQRGSLDSAAATVFLQAWLDSQKTDDTE